MDYTTTIQNCFELGCIHDAVVLFESCIQNAFPTFHFRKLELIRFTNHPQFMEGRSLNHVFEIQKSELHGFGVWEVNCRRVTMGKTPDHQVYLDYSSLEFARYVE